MTMARHGPAELGPFGIDGMALAWQCTLNAYAFAGLPMPESDVVRSTWRFVPFNE